MEMQVRSSIQNLVLAFRADATDAQCWDYKHSSYPDYAFRAVTKSHHVADNSGKRMAKIALGAGAFSAACAHPTDKDKVVKVWLNGVDGAWHYINKCWQLQGTGEEQEWMPVVYELGMCMGKPYAVMEKLVPYAKADTVLTFSPMHWEILFEDTFGFAPNDIHCANVMYRRVLASDGTLQEVGVITDPVTDWGIIMQFKQTANDVTKTPSL